MDLGTPNDKSLENVDHSPIRLNNAESMPRLSAMSGAKDDISQLSSLNSASMQWKLERNKMQQTILALSQEVEYLSCQNEKLLTDMRRKQAKGTDGGHNYYDVYVKTQEELIKLRQAHAVLISMIRDGNISLSKDNM